MDYGGYAIVNKKADRMDEILTSKELSAYLKTSEKTIYRLLSKCEIPAFKVGTVWRFKKEDIDKWIKKNSQEVA